MKAVILKIAKFGGIVAATCLVFAAGGVTYSNVTGESFSEISKSTWDRLFPEEHHSHGR